MNHHHTCPQATVDSVAAVCFAGSLLIVAKGTKPNPCYRVTIQRSLIDIWPPQFYVEACPPDEVCIQVIADYVTARVFAVGSCPETITVHGANGPHKVPVTCVKSWELFLDAMKQHLGVTSLLPTMVNAAGLDRVLPEEPDANTATGFSEESFEGAFRNAVAQLDMQYPYPDSLGDVRVLKQGALFGGIAGLWNLYYVQVSLTW